MILLLLMSASDLPRAAGSWKGPPAGMELALIVARGSGQRQSRGFRAAPHTMPSYPVHLFLDVGLACCHILGIQLTQSGSRSQQDRLSLVRTKMGSRCDLQRAGAEPLGDPLPASLPLPRTVCLGPRVPASNTGVSPKVYSCRGGRQRMLCVIGHAAICQTYYVQVTRVIASTSKDVADGGQLTVGRNTSKTDFQRALLTLPQP
ncbi:hypothetical protein B0T24DRAFT_30372 [Lasiosphaeria ovina]|uniref:Uncharacterized protein n=1 Tax=Lasiosphaeria ovina TaxID=92902 RepID=A0AAE0NKA4_9PEZI|nr:hypothetical protein B0T24DRAFT_30372 [Lasiosphaeria ovina]